MPYTMPKWQPLYMPKLWQPLYMSKYMAKWQPYV